jgi:hypothetical protein
MQETRKVCPYERLKENKKLSPEPVLSINWVAVQELEAPTVEEPLFGAPLPVMVRLVTADGGA